jgi:hypothetical protein
MAGAISDRIAPVGHKTKLYLGPLNTPAVIGKVINEDKLDTCITDSMSPDSLDYVILFINESSLGKSPQRLRLQKVSGLTQY